MKKILIALLLIVPTIILASPTSVNRIDDHIEPLIRSDYIKGSYFVASSTTNKSAFPYASTTALSATTLCLTTDCRTSWGAGYPFTPTTNFAVTNQATTGILWLRNGLNASSTSRFNGGITMDSNGLTIGRASVSTYPLLVAANGNNIQFDTFSNFYISGSGTAMPVIVQNTNGDFLITNGVAGGAKFRMLPFAGDIYFDNPINGGIIFRNGAVAVERIKIATGGNIGIGTTTPLAKLSVTGSGTGTGYNFMTANSSNAPLFSIQDNGKVGIGTSSPVTTLSINGKGVFIDTAGTVPDIGNASLYVKNTGSSNLFYQMRADSSTGTNFVVTNAGNTGIGTTTPLAKLSVTGTGTGTGYTFLAANSSNVPLFTILDNGSVTQQSVTNSTSAFKVLPSGSSAPALNVDTTNRRVAVGLSATPAYALDVGINDATVYSATSVTPQGARILNSDTTANSTSAFYFSMGGTGTAIAAINGIRLSADNSALVFRNEIAGVITESMGIYGKNVGIGTTSPYLGLSVADGGVFGADVRASTFTATSTTATSTFAGKIQAGSYSGSNGTPGFTGTCTLASITTITVEDGLITACN